MENYKRTRTCGELSAADAGTVQILNGWVYRKRDHGGISFINLRDRYGITQVVVDENADEKLLAVTAELRNEYCIAVCGTVRLRPDSMKNSGMTTGDVELLAENIVILNKCAVLPFLIEDETGAKDELRLKYRYLDLRSPAMQKRIRLRSEITFAVREWMRSRGFYEIETPTFIRSTPEGARDYLVPSRLYAGKFYALPQSPQLYKQLLMVAGFDKYFQIARCYRDEDSRGDRQPEFTQIDIEMSFVSRDDVLKMTEGLFFHVFKKCLDLELPAEFPRLSYDEAMESYGTDKPDLRFDMKLRDFSAFAAASGFEAFKAALESGGAVKALVVPGGAAYSRRQIEELEAHAKIYRAKGLAWMKIAGTEAEPALEGGAAKFFAAQAAAISAGLGAKGGDLILVVADSKRRTANVSLGAVRTRLGADLGLCDPAKFRFVWIVDFPLFEFNEEEGHWEAAHHLFSCPQEQYHANMEADPGSVKGDLYDLVLNGYELASGSIRIHDPELQKRVFKVVGLAEAEAAQKFGFLTEAFSYGAPPHGGIAPGLDRLAMLMSGDSSIKEVIAFPKNSFAQNPMDGSPGAVDATQLAELHLALVDESGKDG
ncbi:MAG: aspartate--tRNA ligase [Spirochaetaceae bacterium]|jgi:aspartyl-tRNA synthetase|nr:aspartate--tRNA ligase [Spirochaetaceae bacterium]